MSELNKQEAMNRLDTAIGQVLRAIDAYPIEKQAYAIMCVHQHSTIAATVTLAKLQCAVRAQNKLGAGADPKVKSALTVACKATKQLGEALMTATHIVSPKLAADFRKQVIKQLEETLASEGTTTESE